MWTYRVSLNRRAIWSRGALRRPAWRSPGSIGRISVNETSVQFNLRPASEDDREFLYALHCRTMRDVIEKTWGWDEAWQRRDFDRRFREYAVSIIEGDGQAVGGLLLERKPDSLYVHEVQVLPEHQGQG